MLTALQCLFSSREHTTGQHSCWSQTFQRQHTFTLFSAEEKIQQNHCYLFFFPKKYRKLSSYTLCYTCPAIFFFFFISYLLTRKERICCWCSSSVDAVSPHNIWDFSFIYVSTSPLHHTMHRLPLQHQYNLHLSNSVCKYPHWNTVLKPQT